MNHKDEDLGNVLNQMMVSRGLLCTSLISGGYHLLDNTVLTRLVQFVEQGGSYAIVVYNSKSERFQREYENAKSLCTRIKGRVGSTQQNNVQLLIPDDTQCYLPPTLNLELSTSYYASGKSENFEGYVTIAKERFVSMLTHSLIHDRTTECGLATVYFQDLIYTWVQNSKKSLGTELLTDPTNDPMIHKWKGKYDNNLEVK